MNFDRKTILAFLLIGLVFILVQSPLYQRMFFPEAYKQAQMEKLKPRPTAAGEETAMGEQPQAAAEPIPAAGAGKEKVLSAATATEPHKDYIVETDLYRATFSNQGGTLKKWVLKEYLKYDGSPVVMLDDQVSENLAIDFISREGDSVSTAGWIFHTDADSFNRVGGEPVKLTFSYEARDGRKIIKEYSFKNAAYDFQLNISMVNWGQMVDDKAYRLVAPSGLHYTEKRATEDQYYAKAAVSASQQVNKSYKSNGTTTRESGNIDWVASRTKYFTLAIIPTTGKGTEASIHGTEMPFGERRDMKWKRFGLELKMPYMRNDVSDQFTVFIGPMHDDLLKSYGVGLEKIMDMGAKIIQPFSIATLWTFKKLHSVIPNYGLVLIVFALLIKLITSPLTHKSFESMKKMQVLQPRLQELKDKYSKDTQRLNQETMKLYKEEGVNPMGGCLPVILQMPLLWALYIVFRATIELRQQGFIWWIKDLSGPDTIATLPFSLPLYGDTVNVLPVVMGATMILQQKLSVTDPKQKAMIYIMPIFMTLIFNGFPSGLNLYYTLFNVLSIVHQRYLMGDPMAAKAETPVKSIKRR